MVFNLVRIHPVSNQLKSTTLSQHDGTASWSYGDSSITDHFFSKQNKKLSSNPGYKRTGIWIGKKWIYLPMYNFYFNLLSFCAKGGTDLPLTMCKNTRKLSRVQLRRPCSSKGFITSARLYISLELSVKTS